MTDSHDGFRDLTSIGDMFKISITHMKGGFPVWEEFIARGMKFQKHFEQTILSFNGFIDSLYKISEVAHNTKGGTHELGTGLINLAMWHRGQEMKLKEMNSALMTKLLGPLQVKVEEWKKTTATLEREHDKELQRSIKDIKEAAKNAMKTGKSLESKLKKDKMSDKTTTLHQQLEHYNHETDRYLKETEDRERKNLNRVLLEERSWFCGFVNAFSRVLDVEVGMLMDLERLQAILKDLSSETSHPAILPDTTREMLESWTIPASPTTLHKKMTTAPSMLSVSSGSSGDSGGPVISGPVIIGPVISGPVMTGSTVLSGSPVGIPIQQQPPTPPNMSLNAPAPPPPPGVPPPSSNRRDSGHLSNNNPPSPPMTMPHPPPCPPPGPPTSVMANVARPPPPTTAPPPSSHPPHSQFQNVSNFPPPPQFSQTLPRSLGSINRGASLDRGLTLTTMAGDSGHFPHGFNANPYNNVAHQGGGVHLPHTANGDHIQNRSLPPVPPGEDPYLPMNSVIVSRQNFGPGQSSTLLRIQDSSHPQLGSNSSSSQLQTIEEPPTETPFSFQEQLMNKVRGRSFSIEANSMNSTAPNSNQDNVYSMPSFNSPQLTRASNSVSGRVGPPPVSSKPNRPPAVAHKPSRAANGHGPGFTQPQSFTQSLDSHHGIGSQFTQAPSPADVDLDLGPEEDNMFARALREKKLRSVQTDDRSNPLVWR